MGGALSWATLFETHPDTPGKLVAFAYAFEHLEIAAYEELKQVVQKIGDTGTVQTADEILPQERAAATKLAESFDHVTDVAVRRSLRPHDPRRCPRFGSTSRCSLPDCRKCSNRRRVEAKSVDRSLAWASLSE